MNPTPQEAPDVSVQVAVRLLESERLSLGRAAELAGHSVPELMELLGHGDVPFLDVAEEPEPVVS